MRRLREGEEAVLPVGFQNLITGDNRDFNVFQTWGINNIEKVSLIAHFNHRSGVKTLRLIISGGASIRAELYHDQTHVFIGKYRLLKEYKGTYPEIFKKIILETHKTSLPAYVYK